MAELLPVWLELKITSRQCKMLLVILTSDWKVIPSPSSFLKKKALNRVGGNLPAAIRKRNKKKLEMKMGSEHSVRRGWCEDYTTFLHLLRCHRLITIGMPKHNHHPTLTKWKCVSFLPSFIIFRNVSVSIQSDSFHRASIFLDPSSRSQFVSSWLKNYALFCLSKK